MVSRKLISIMDISASASTTLWPGSRLLCIGGDLQVCFILFSVEKLCPSTIFVLTAFHPLPGYYLSFMVFSLRRNFFPFSVQAVALMVFQGSPVSGIGVRKDGCSLLQLAL
jgi:hypothetical protein